MSTTPPREEPEMTTNIDRATEVVRDVFNSMSPSITLGGGVTVIAQALADAGLLMPDPTEPTCHNHRGEPIWETEGATKIMTPGMLPVSLMGPFAQGWDMHPIEARDIAYSLLAAANHAEQEQGNG